MVLAGFIKPRHYLHLLEAADKALYRAEKNGRNRAEIATERDLIQLWARVMPGRIRSGILTLRMPDR